MKVDSAMPTPPKANPTSTAAKNATTAGPAVVSPSATISTRNAAA
jgi:hypothetical protein